MQKRKISASNFDKINSQNKGFSPRTIMLGFVFLVLTSLIILYAYSPITGRMILSSQLDQDNYDAGDKITGVVSLQMQEGDIIPEDTKISFVVSGDQTKCQTKYICPISGEVDWYKINSTSGECYLKNEDPDKSCCSLNSLNCNQIIKNSGFENELNNWVFSKTGNQYPYSNQDNLTLYDDEGNLEYSSRVAKISTTEITNTGSGILTQTFSTPIIVQSLISNKPNLAVSSANYYLKDGFSLYYNITVCNTGYGKTTKAFYVKIIENKTGTTTTQSKGYLITKNLTQGECITNTVSAISDWPNRKATIFADALNAISEISESDNIKEISLNNYYKKDLTFNLYSATSEYGSLFINYTIEVCNNYNSSLGPFNVSIYSPTSSVNLWNTNEPTISTTPSTYIQFGSISAGSCSKQSKSYSLVVLNAPYPAIMNPLENGTYYYWVWIDKENVTKDYPDNNKEQNSFQVGTTGGITQEQYAFSSDLENNIDNTESGEQKILFFDSTPYGSSTNNFSLGWIAYADLSSQTGCAFEIIITGKNSTTLKRLHYYYQISDICSAPSNTATDVYLTQNYNYDTGLIDVYTNLYWDWMAAYPNGINDELTNISLVSIGKKSDYDYYMQDVYFDNIRLDKTSGLEPVNEISCEEQGKACCLSGAGSGVYYGEQLSCSEGYECWGECAQKEYTLAQFIALSTTPSKYDKAEGDCYDAGSGTSLDDYCGEYTGCTNCVGEGYTACSDTSSSAVTKCRDWDNIYSLNLSKIGLYAPDEDGTYYLRVLFTYKTTNLDMINISTYDVPLIVGATTNYTGYCPSTDYTSGCITNSLGSCINNARSYNRTCYYSGTDTTCSSFKYITGTEYCASNYTTTPVACTESGWQCDEWTECLDGSQARTCTKTDTMCDTSLTNSYVPTQQRACSQELPSETTKTDWVKILIYVGIGLGVVALGFGIFFLIKFLKSRPKKIKKPEAKEKEEYPELNAYIKDAMAAGMSQQEIRAKLQEAGWPKENVEKAFKNFK